MAEGQGVLSLAVVARRLDRAEIPWAVFAGAAALVYGSNRPLTDVDILIAAADGTRAVELFPEARVMYRDDGAVSLIELPGFDIAAGLGTDAAAACAVDLDARMSVRLERHEIEGLDVPVIPPEDNVLLKALWGRGAQVGKHDWEDMRAMIAHLPALDWEYLRWRAEAYRPVERVRRVLERLEREERDVRGRARS